MSKVAVVTGGLSGMGLACAQALAAEGHRVAVGSRRAGAGEFDFSAPLDVSDQASVDGFFAGVEAALGPVDILVNAAGIYQEAFLADHSDAAWFDQIDVNLSGCFRTMRAVMPGMKARGWGRIVNIASTAGRVGAAGYAGYCASKAGVIALSKTAAIEGAPFGITCVSVSPTWVETPMMEAALERHARDAGTSVEAAKAELYGSNPQGRLVQPGEIADFVTFACSEAAKGLTNEDIQINAGADW